MARKKQQQPTQWQLFVSQWLSEECCGQPMSSGYDTVIVSEFDFYGEAQAYYRDCQLCGNIETRRAPTLKADFDYDVAHGARY